MLNFNSTKSYSGTFIKQNGEVRTMNFVRAQDLPSAFLSTQIKGNGAASNLDEGFELVWDLDKKGFRVFNWNNGFVYTK